MVLNTRSPSLQYQVKLLEDETRQGNTRPSHTKTKIATEILDEIIPHTGVYKDVLTMVLKTFHQAIYSSTLTSSADSETQAFLPYFEMVFRLEEERHTAAEVLKDESEQLRSEVSKKMHESQNFAARLDEKNTKIAELSAQIGGIAEEISKREELINDLKYKLAEELGNTAAIQEEMSTLRDFFEEEVIEKEEEILQVSTYKAEYYDMQNKFFNYNEKSSQDEPDKESVILQRQLVGILNNLLDEQDNFRDRYNALVLDGATSEELPEWNKRYILMREAFSKQSLTVMNELNLLNTHINYESKVTGTVNREDDETAEKEKEVNVKNLFAEGCDPFNSREIITAKYSACVAVSTNDCITFTYLPGTRQCKSCDAMVLICPHLYFQQSSVIELPAGCTHIKVTRPYLDPPPIQCMKEVLQISEIISEDESVEDSGINRAGRGNEQFNSQGNSLETRSVKSREHLGSRGKSRELLSSREKSREARILREKSRDSLTSRDLNKKLMNMWRTCEKSYYHESRDLSEEHVITAIHHFNLYLSNLTKEDQYKSTLDHLADFLRGQYQLDELMEIVKVDILNAVSLFAPDNPFIAIFGAVLAGSVDPIVFKYVYLLNDILLSLDLVCPLDLRPVMMILYPHLTDEDIDPHVLSFSSHSNNKMSAHLVSNYVMSCIVRDREPKVQETVSKLKQNSGLDPWKMSYPEFNGAMERVYPMATNKSKEHYFKCSSCNCEEQKEKVETQLLGQVAAFMQLQEMYPKVITEINQRIKYFRQKIPAEMLEAGIKQKESSSFVNIPSMEQTKKQLVAISKAAKSLELLNINPCWREDVAIGPEYLDLTCPLSL